MLRRSVRSSVSRSAEQSTDGPADNRIVRYSGVSLRFLNKLRDDILEEKVAPEVELFTVEKQLCVTTLKGSSAEIRAGSTVRVTKVTDKGVKKCRMQFVGAFDLPENALLEPKPRHRWTIEDVCEFVVLEETRADKLFYLDLLDTADVGQRFQGTFLSQARKSSFFDLVDSLLAFNEGRDLSTQFVWFDIFCANQPLLTLRDEDLDADIQKNREELLKVGLHDAISKFDDRLIFFNSWLEPYPIQRAWCVWEIFGCVKTGKSLDILFRPGEEDVFVETLVRDRKEVVKGIMNLRLEDAECFVRSDKVEIDSAVAQQVGYHRLNVTISKLVLKWLKVFADKVVERERAKPGSHSSKLFAKILSETGIFFLDHLGHLDDAFQLLEESLEVYNHLGEVSTLEVANVIHEIGRVLQAQGEYDEALKKFEQVLEMKEKVLGDKDHPEMATTRHNIASVLQKKSEYDAALKQYEEVLRIKIKTFGGTDHPSVAATLHQIGGILQAKGEYDKALKQFNEVLRIEISSYGTKEHPSVATTLHNIAAVLQDKGKFKAAFKQHEEVLRIREKAYGGRNHPKVAATLISMAECLNRMSREREAVSLLEEASSALEAVPEKSYQAWLLFVRGVTQRQCGRMKQSCDDLEACIHIWTMELKQNINHTGVQDAMFELGKTKRVLGETDAATKLFQDVLRVRQKLYQDPQHSKVWEVEQELRRATKKHGPLGCILRMF